ncbi:SAP domain-containing protein [Brevibacillus reuszeri]|uniref:SAP domain-containing protein n=1 Tax=Brevibacillus reuszeri TaxID=54915 RepID=UPI003D254391
MINKAQSKKSATVLKEELKKRGLKTTGKKAELVKRLLEEASHEEINLRFTRRTYQLPPASCYKVDYSTRYHSHLVPPSC